MCFYPRMLTITLALLGVLASIPAQAEDYDLVISNGRVMDPESGLDAIRNVGIKDGRIAKVTKKKIKGKESIDARVTSSPGVHRRSRAHHGHPAGSEGPSSGTA